MFCKHHESHTQVSGGSSDGSSDVQGSHTDISFLAKCTGLSLTVRCCCWVWPVTLHSGPSLLFLIFTQTTSLHESKKKIHKRSTSGVRRSNRPHIINKDRVHLTCKRVVWIAVSISADYIYGYLHPETLRQLTRTGRSNTSDWTQSQKYLPQLFIFMMICTEDDFITHIMCQSISVRHDVIITSLDTGEKEKQKCAPLCLNTTRAAL